MLFRNRVKEPLILFILTLVLLTLGKFQGDHLRGAAMAVMQPFWSSFSSSSTEHSAKVIYRTPTLWNSTLWIDAGHPTVAMNSPVLKQGALIGVIDYVGIHQSRVRLITDSHLSPAVRVLRGPLAKQKILYDIDQLVQDLSFLTEETKTALFTELDSLKKELFEEGTSWYLAKGTLQGSSLPLSKPNALLLKGIGFNLDFPDHRSPARDLRTGKAPSNPPIPLIQVNDLLITSGLDALFPEGIPVAYVTHVDPLQEGDTHYTIEAIPVVRELIDLHEVDILPPIATDPDDLPPSFLRK